MDAFTVADKPPVSALRWATMGEARIPRDWNGNRATVDEFNDQRVLGDRHALRPCLGKFTQ